jgi:hypothetical protein
MEKLPLVAAIKKKIISKRGALIFLNSLGKTIKLPFSLLITIVNK